MTVRQRSWEPSSRGSSSRLRGRALPQGRDRKSTRLKLQSRLHLVCRLLLEKKKKLSACSTSCAAQSSVRAGASSPKTSRNSVALAESSMRHCRTPPCLDTTSHPPRRAYLL